jgi:hypothetical protein
MGWRADVERERVEARDFKRRPLRQRMPYYFHVTLFTTAILVLLALYIRASLYG